MSFQSENDFRVAVDSDSEIEFNSELDSQSEYERGFNSELDSQSENEREFNSELDSQSENERGFNSELDSQSENERGFNSELDSQSEYERGFNSELDSHSEYDSSQRMDCSEDEGSMEDNENKEVSDDIFMNQESLVNESELPSCSKRKKKKNIRQVQEADAIESQTDDDWIVLKTNLKDVIKKRPVKPNFIIPSGPMVNTKHWKTVDYFLQFFPLEVFEKITKETNRYATQFIKKSGKLSKSSRYHKWKNTDISEMMTFVGLEMAMGLINKPALSDYWETSEITQTPFFSKVMSRNRYEILRSFLHFNNKEQRVPKGTPEYDPLFKIRPIIDMVIPTYLDSYWPDENVLVIESLLKFKRKKIFYYNHWPNKDGIKIWALCDATNGYLLVWKVYAGNTRGSLRTVKDRVVDLCQPIHNTGRTVYCNNYFSSPALFVEMKSKGLNTCGVVNHFCPGLPSRIREKLITLRKGDDPHFFYQRKTGLLACMSIDFGSVITLSSVHDNQTFKVSSKKKYGNKFIKVKKPKMLSDYNKYMNRVNILNTKMSHYRFSNMAKKNFHIIYYFIKEVALINGHILYNSINHEEISLKDFRKKVINELMCPYLAEKKYIKETTKQTVRIFESSARLTGRHFARKSEKKGVYKDCIVCSKWEQRQRTRYYCVQCQDKPFICPGKCFKRFHTLKNYKNN